MLSGSSLGAQWELSGSSSKWRLLNCIDDKSAFKWWVSLVIRKRNRMVNKVKGKYWQTTHKFGIRIPKSVAESFQIDKENGNTYWADAIAKEMSKAKVAYVPIEGVTPEEVRANNVDQLCRIQCQNGLYTESKVCGRRSYNRTPQLTHIL
jgi:hypothetical protein